jgi:prepilin signal peptidase PulO-like enzyme (type II secretory pathway)
MLVVSIVFGVFGLIVGSFLNVVILRHGERPLGGRSACMSCGATLQWFELIPVFSWIALRGKCRSCRSRISIQYPLVEAATGILFALIGAALFQHGVAAITVSSMTNAALSLAIASLLICIMAYDLYYMIIPDEWVYLFAALALVASLLAPFANAPWVLLSGPLSAAPLYLLWLVSGGKWMGLGDPKLALGMGWLLGPSLGLVAVFFAFIIGAVISVCVLIPVSALRAGPGRITIKSEVPFGPFLIASTFALWFVALYGVGPTLLALFT